MKKEALVQVITSAGFAVSSQVFAYLPAQSPLIHSMIRYAVAPGDSVSFTGDFRNWYLDFVRFPPGDPRGYLRDVEIGGTRYSASVFKIKSIVFLDTLIQKIV